MALLKPKIVVSGPEIGGNLPWSCIRMGVFLSGGKAVRATSKNYKNHTDLQGLILSGGSDIHPLLYGENSVIDTIYDEPRDRMEKELIQRALDKHSPILGICRGMQMLNVFFGGTLHQEMGRVFDDYAPHDSTIGKIFARHDIIIDPNTNLGKLFNRNKLRVNSLHHQCVNKLADGFTVCARLKNGLIQAIEKENNIFGVQWHPEYMLYKESQRALFNYFVTLSQERS